MKKIEIKQFFLKANYFFAFLSLFLLSYTFYRAEIVHGSSQFKYYLKYYLIFSTSLVFWIYVINTNIEKRIMFSITGFFVLIFLYSFEVIKFYNFSINRLSKDNINFSNPINEKIVLLQKLNKSNIIARPSVIPNIFLNESKNNLFPISGISNVKTVFCKEGPKYSIYTSDRYGFNNPDDNWGDTVENILIGDSFAQGACVNEGEDIASRLRTLTAKTTLTLGMAGNGPLIELASLKEYVSDINVKNIFWLYFERNDLDDLRKEKKNKILIKYLNDNFSQELKKKQSTINSIIEKTILYEKVKIQQNNLKIKKKYSDHAFQKIIRLKILRDNLALDRGLNFKIDPIFEKIIVQAKRIAEEKNSKFYFVYLPDKETFKKHNLTKKNFYRKKDIFDILKKNDINLIDLHSSLFAKEDDPLDLFAYRIYGHYSSSAYLKIAKILNAYID
jgi:hypothetical protein